MKTMPWTWWMQRSLIERDMTVLTGSDIRQWQNVVSIVCHYRMSLLPPYEIYQWRILRYIIAKYIINMYIYNIHVYCPVQTWLLYSWYHSYCPGHPIHVRGFSLSHGREIIFHIILFKIILNIVQRSHMNSCQHSIHAVT